MTGSKVSNKSSVTAAVIKRKVRGWTVALKLSVKDRTGTGKTFVTLTMECALAGRTACPHSSGVTAHTPGQQFWVTLQRGKLQRR